MIDREVTPLCAAALVAALLATAAYAEPAPAVPAEEHAHHPEPHAHDAPETLGSVHFPISCDPAVQPAFDRAVALLHSFGYAQSREAFAAVAAQDADCGMAHWGIAMSLYHPIWAPPSAADLAQGQAAAERAATLGAKSERERGYIAATSAFYRDAATRDHRTRAAAFRLAFEGLAARHPEDHEAAVFHALALLATAPPADATFAQQRRAAEILNGLLPKEPNHPGVAHYLIHSFDYPELAELALPAARAYAKIAPSSAHAQHMPSHIFTRLGLWSESITSNLDSERTANELVARTHPGAAAFDALHALDYLEYGYLQLGDDARAREVLERAKRATSFDEAQFAAGYALAAIPARYELERRQWAAAAALPLPPTNLPWDRFAYALAVTHFARAVGAARSGDPARAHTAVDEVAAIQARLAQAGPAGPYDWSAQVESLRLAAAGWLARAERPAAAAAAASGDGEAIRLLRSAAMLQERAGKHPVTPGEILPARELLGDLLFELGRPAEALTEYEQSLRSAPNRLYALTGAARAAEATGNTQRARELWSRIAEQAVPSSDREEVRQARAAAQRGSE